jgi:hypothetical protein
MHLFLRFLAKIRTKICGTLAGKHFFHATGCVFSLLYLCNTWWGNLWERDHLEDPGVEERIILRWNFRKWDGGKGGMDWIDLSQVRDMWWAL